MDKSELLQIRDVIKLETTEGLHMDFEVVGTVEDSKNPNQMYAICYNKDTDTLVVTHMDGNLLEDIVQSQEILDDFCVLAEQVRQER